MHVDRKKLLPAWPRTPLSPRLASKYANGSLLCTTQENFPSDSYVGTGLKIPEDRSSLDALPPLLTTFTNTPTAIDETSAAATSAILAIVTTT